MPVQGEAQIPALSMNEKEATLMRFVEDKWLCETELGFCIGVSCLSGLCVHVQRWLDDIRAASAWP